nr:hypothetical protein XAC3610_8090002 [Xanthomonas citri pv. citri]
MISQEEMWGNLRVWWVIQTIPRRIATGQRSAWLTSTKFLHSYFESTQEIAATAHLPVSLLT